MRKKDRGGQKKSSRPQPLIEVLTDDAIHEAVESLSPQQQSPASCENQDATPETQRGVGDTLMPLSGAAPEATPTHRAPLVPAETLDTSDPPLQEVASVVADDAAFDAKVTSIRPPPLPKFEPVELPVPPDPPLLTPDPGTEPDPDISTRRMESVSIPPPKEVSTETSAQPVVAQPAIEIVRPLEFPEDMPRCGYPTLSPQRASAPTTPPKKKSARNTVIALVAFAALCVSMFAVIVWHSVSAVIGHTVAGSHAAGAARDASSDKEAARDADTTPTEAPVVQTATPTEPSAAPISEPPSWPADRIRREHETVALKDMPTAEYLDKWDCPYPSGKIPSVKIVDPDTGEKILFRVMYKCIRTPIAPPTSP